jgi:hypothetical protein
VAEVWHAPVQTTTRYDTWHFRSSCWNWPTTDYDERTNKPTTVGFCNECEANDPVS